MPLLASIYAAFLSIIAIHSLNLHIKEKERLWFTILDLISDLSLLIVFILSWFPQVSQTLGLTTVVLFLFSAAWFIVWTPHNLSKFAQKDFPPEENRLFKRFVFTVGVVLILPGYWFGGLGVFRGW